MVRPQADDPVDGSHRVEKVIGALAVAWTVTYVLAALVGFVVLPRYWTQLVPFLVVGIIVALRPLAPPRSLAMATLGAAAFFLVNVNGIAYRAADQHSFSLVERSGEYTALLDLHDDAATAIEALPTDVPVYYSLATHYRMSYPASGYVDEPLPNGINLLTVPADARGDLDSYPDDFYLVVDRPNRTSGAIAELWARAEADPLVHTEATRLSRHGFSIVIVRVAQRP